MSDDGTMRYDAAGLADYSSAMTSYGQELDQIRQEALHELANVQHVFTTEHGGSDAYVQAQNLINDGIDEGKQVILRHGSAIDQSSQDFIAQDMAAAQAFGGI